MTAADHVHALLRRAERLDRKPYAGRTMTAAASVLRYRARQIASAAIMAPTPTEQRTAEQALAELRTIL